MTRRFPFSPGLVEFDQQPLPDLLARRSILRPESVEVDDPGAVKLLTLAQDPGPRGSAYAGLISIHAERAHGRAEDGDRGT